MARTTATNPFRRIASIAAILLALLVSAPALADTGDSATGAAATASPAASTSPVQATVILVSPTGVEWTKAPNLASVEVTDIAWTDSGFRLHGVEWTVVAQGSHVPVGVSLRGVEWTLISGN